MCEVGLDPVSVKATGTVSLGDAAGLLLTGGTDINPNRYGKSPHPKTEKDVDDKRDALELDLIRQALEKDLPVLAICRGLQILNVYHGGTLIQHLPSVARHEVRGPNPANSVHEVTIEPDSLLARIAGANSWRVNSRHHQAVDEVGSNLQISARDSEDGTVEGLERPGRSFVVAVQWHPEDQFIQHPEQLKLFQSFADAVTSRT